MRTRVLPVIWLACQLPILNGCRHSPQQEVEKPQVVGFSVLQAQDVPLDREYVARTDAFYNVDVRPRVSGELVSYHFVDGQAVQKGRLLFQIDPVPYRIAVQAAQAHLAHAESDRAEAQAQLHKAEADVARYEPLAKIHAIPEQDLADARATQQVREAQLKQADAEVQVQRTTVSEAQLKLSYTQIYSPISGTIGERQVDPGNLVSTDEKMPLATVSTDNPVLVTFSISDADYLKLFAPSRNDTRRDSKPHYELVLADGSAYPQKGQFHAISRALNQQTDTLTVVLTFPNPLHILRPGEFVQVRAALEQSEHTLLVPITAVRTLQGTQSVLLLDGASKVVQRTISTSSRQGDNYVVTSGLHPGDKVIIEGQNKVSSGDTVEAHAADSKHLAPGDADAAGFEQ